MENLEPHRHTRLQSPRLIRILKLLPSIKQNAPIKCRLTELNIDKYVSHGYKTPGPYEALSYVWGSRSGSILIDCNGKSLLVTENCHTALVRLRRRLWRRTLWIDSICIDQEESKPSEEERVVQIQLMGEVYRIARCVIVWLGQCSVSTRKTLMILQAAAILKLSGERIPDFFLETWREDILRKLVDQLRDNTTFYQSWIELQNNSWFSRCWTIQEVAFSRKCVVNWGSSSIRWKLLPIGVYDIESRIVSLSGINSGFFPAIDVREELRRFINSQGAESSPMMRRVQFSQDNSSHSTFQLIELQNSFPGSFDMEMSLLSSALEHDATVPHDKIYSIYPLLRFWNPDLPRVNYDQPFEMLCEELTRCWFHSKQNLNIILLAARLPSKESRLPSWVPDWGNRQSALDYRLTIHKNGVGNSRGQSHPLSRASNGSSLNESPKTITGELHLHGLSVGLISRVLVCNTPNNLSSKQSVPENFRVFRTWCCAVNDSSIYSTRKELQHSLGATIFTYSSNVYWKDSGLGVVLRLLYDLMLYPDCQLLNSAQAKKAYELFLEVEAGDETYFKALGELATSLGTSLIDNQSPDLDDLFFGIYKQSPTKTRVFERIKLAVSTLSTRLTELQNHSLLFLDSCYGSAAYTAQQDDEVYLLKGLDVPVVLRPAGENYSFIGPCSYIYGVTEGQRWPEDESELRDIVLV
ncbi:putative het-domain-containing protein [Botrytis fragariae]|uniref:Putative het-domain-containing protein n=1 Tax=Botrytis fragariae TaxID=1964551 RepID=A0A8H6ALD8_9HELO|nr:putative het-domain-containing protein [Botrytis fragariae]KAF5869481.1 putative het-domain-containing protein [Botrytis fragariae]